MKQSRVVGASIALLLVASVAGAQGERGRGSDDHGRSVPEAEQHQRVAQQQQRVTDLKKHLDEQVRTLPQQRAQLQQDHRTAQYAATQRYEQGIREQQGRVQVDRDFARDPYITTPHSYRYVIGGTTHMTNQYGADVLKRAVNDGYEQGVLAGRADRQDHWKSNYENSIAYRDANYGYDGNYIDLPDYNYYFRQGFQRGYADGYNSRSQYGTSTGTVIGVAAAVLAGILVLKAIN